MTIKQKIKQVKKLLKKLNIKIIKERELSGCGKSFIFRIFGANYNLFVSPWNDFGLHCIFGAEDKFQKMIDFEKDLSRIEPILTILKQFEESR